MQLLEIKNDIAKILYSPLENHLLLADFLLIEDVNQSLIAQVIDIESSAEPNANIAAVKFSLSINKNANLSTYNGYTPSKDARIIYIEPSEIAQLIQSPKTNIFWGYLAAHPSTSVSLGFSFLREKPYIQCDKIDNATTIATNILYGLQKNKKRTIIIDFDGRYKKLDVTTRLNISKEYKLPLNVDAFDFIAENDLEDCAPENKALIQGILLELQSYVSTLEDGFIPFDIFKNVIDAECRKNPIPELIIFKNKLVKYQQKSLFAQNKEQFNFVNRILSKNNTTIVDASGVDEKWHRFILETIASQIDKKCYLIVNINDSNATKRTIKAIYDNENVRPIVISPYNTKHTFQLKTICKNLILFAPIEKVDDFEVYSSFLYKLNQKEFIIWSENTFYMPLILKLRALDKDYLNQAISQEIKSDVDRIFTATQPSIEAEITIPDEIIVKPESEEDTSKKQSMNEKIIRAISSKDKKDDIPVKEVVEPEPDKAADELTEDDLDFLDGISHLIISDEETHPEHETYTIVEDSKPKNQIDEIEPAIGVETEKTEALNENIEAQQLINVIQANEILEIDDNTISPEPEEILAEQAPQKEAEPDIIETSNIIDIEDLDNLTVEPKEEPQPIYQEIQTVEKEKTVEITEPKIQENKTVTAVEIKKAEPKIEQPEQLKEPVLVPAPKKTLEQKIMEKKKLSVPIYEAKTAEPAAEATKFKEGNFVYHAKYGRGIIEKIITYGTKTLCSIEFDNVGRRLLDPNLADIKPA